MTILSQVVIQYSGEITRPTTVTLHVTPMITMKVYFCVWNFFSRSVCLPTCTCHENCTIGVKGCNILSRYFKVCINWIQSANPACAVRYYMTMGASTHNLLMHAPTGVCMIMWLWYAMTSTTTTLPKYTQCSSVLSVLILVLHLQGFVQSLQQARNPRYVVV